MNPEEGELRPQLLDRFGLCVNIEGLRNPDDRVSVVKHRIVFEEDPLNFSQKWKRESEILAENIIDAIGCYPRVNISDSILYKIANRSLDASVDGHRSDIVMLKAAKTIAAFHKRDSVIDSDIDEAAELTLPHRIRRKPFDEITAPTMEKR
jgi:magnesium chelatase subunit I